MKRLFKVIGNANFDTSYFNNKKLAKRCRDEREKMGCNCYISKGPDHPSFGIVKPSSIHPKRKGSKKE